MSPTCRKTVVLVAAVVVLGCTLTLSTRAQQPAKPPAGEPQPSRAPAGDLGRAKEITALIEQGQLSLRAATEMAEKHTKGIAFEARCEVQSRATGDLDRGGPGGATTPDVKADRRLVYEVSCFAKDHLATVRVDAAAKKVLD